MSGAPVSRAERHTIALSGAVSQEEKLRRRRLRQLARKTPEQRRRLLQYQRRHNEKDGRLVYCDYCDLFISASDKPLARHMNGWKHLDAVEAYWGMAEHAETVWIGEIRDRVREAWKLAQTQQQQQRLRKASHVGLAAPLPSVQVAPNVRVGGIGARVSADTCGTQGGVLPSPPAQSAHPPPPPPPAS